MQVHRPRQAWTIGLISTLFFLTSGGALRAKWVGLARCGQGSVLLNRDAAVLHRGRKLRRLMSAQPTERRSKEGSKWNTRAS